jgi:hypothetical protein
MTTYLGRIERVIEPGEIRTDYSYGQRSETVTNHMGFSATKSYNAPGWLVYSTDYDSKAVTYTHYSNGKVKTSQVNGQPATLVTIVYDISGNVTSSTDPSWDENISALSTFIDYSVS